MTAPSAHATARRNLAERIDRYLREQAALSTPMFSDWRADQVLAAIEMLDSKQFADGEWVIMKVEKPQLWEPAGYLAAVQNYAPCSLSA